MSVSKVTFHSYEIGQYAQYDNSVKMTFKPHRKKGLYYKWFYGDVIIYNGWYDLPDTVLFDISYKEHCITQNLNGHHLIESSMMLYLNTLRNKD